MNKFNIVLGHNILKLSSNIASLVKQEAILNPGENIYIIVPDQYTLTAENFFMNVIPDYLMLNIKILSFKHLATEVFSHIYSDKVILADGGKKLLISEAYNNVQSLLIYYKIKLSINFIDSLSTQFSELKLYRIQPDDLCDENGVYPSPKVHDIALIYKEYENLLKDKYSDPDDRLSEMCTIINKKHLYSNNIFFIDMFKVLNATELNIIKTLYSTGVDITVSVRTTVYTDNADFNSPISNIYRRLKKIATDCGGLINETIVKDPWSINNALQFAEKNLFSRNCASYGKKTDSVYFYQASDPFDEIDHIACEITSLVRDKGMRYKDIAIVTRDIGSYESYMDVIFSEYNIPVFYHKKTVLKQKTAVRFISALLRICCDKYVNEDFLDLLKTGVLNYTSDETAAFEQYIYTWSLKYFNQFTKPFKRSINGLSDISNDNKTDLSMLESAEKVRNEIINIISPLKNHFKTYTVKQICTEIYQILDDVGIEKKLKNMSDEYLHFGENMLYEENIQIYDMISDVFDEIVTVASDKQLDAIHFNEVFETVINGFNIDIIPTSVDEVLAGNADTIPILQHKQIFVFGMTDGDFPSTPVDEGLINDIDRRYLKDHGINIGINMRDKYLYELYIAYFCITSATERTNLSYPMLFKGEKKPSTAYSEMRNIFNLNTQSIPPDSDIPQTFIPRIQCLKPSFGLYVRTGICELKEYFDDCTYKKYFLNKEADYKLSKETSSALFGTDMNLSATKVDTFYHCPFQYFYKYGLNLHINSQAKFDPRNAGTFIHYMFQTIMTDKEWINLTNEQLKHNIQLYTNQYFNLLLNDDLPSSAFEAYKNNLIRKVYVLILRFKTELSQSLYKPQKFELKIARDGEILPIEIAVDGGSVHMTGQIDRVDSYEINGETYLRVIDYKTGSKKFDLGVIYSGIDIQLLMYMYALRENGKNLFNNIKPAGVMYVSARNDIINELNEKETFNTGIYSSYPDSLKAINNTNDIPEKISGFDIIDPEDFNNIFLHIKSLLKKMGTQLLQGNINKNPIKIKSKVDGCQYCDIKNVCTQYGIYNEICEKNTTDIITDLNGDADIDE